MACYVLTQQRPLASSQLYGKIFPPKGKFLFFNGLALGTYLLLGELILVQPHYP